MNDGDSNMEDDPTLQDCCRRDLEASRKSDQLKERLREVDRTRQRERIEAAVLSEAPQHDSFDCTDPICDVGGCCGGIDAELQQVRERRLQQLRAQAACQAEAAALQYGILHNMPPDNALELILLAKLSLCYMASGAASDGDLDQIMQTLSRTQQDTLFLRAEFVAGSKLAEHCRMPGPGLVVLREGRPIAAGPLEAFFVDGRISSAAVDAWLQQSAMASPAFLPACAAGSTDSEGSDADDWKEPCALCGRTYPHEHVSAK